MAAPEGPCAICGVVGPLTFEHIPPRSAFNSERAFTRTFDQASAVHPLDSFRGRIKQGGLGEFSLCAACNNATGDWYAKEYASWAQQAAVLLQRADSDPVGTYLYHGFPLRFFKQAIAMFMSIDRPSLTNRRPELRRFLLSRRARGYDPTLRLYGFYNPSTRRRRHSMVAHLRTDGGGPPTIFSEMTAFPFGFVLCDGTPPPDPRLADLTFLAGYGYEEFAHVPIRMPAFPTIAHFPGIYQTVVEARSMRKPDDSERGFDDLVFG